MTEPQRVLVVDDSVSICKTMSLILRRQGFDVACATDGPSAVEMVKERPYGVVLLDIRLPGMDGVKVNKSIKSLRPGARVAMMTAYAMEDKVREALDGGAEKVFYKPLDIDAVLQYIKASQPLDEKCDQGSSGIVAGKIESDGTMDGRIDG